MEAENGDGFDFSEKLIIEVSNALDLMVISVVQKVALDFNIGLKGLAENGLADDDLFVVVNGFILDDLEESDVGQID